MNVPVVRSSDNSQCLSAGLGQGVLEFRPLRPSLYWHTVAEMRLTIRLMQPPATTDIEEISGYQE